ITATPAPRTTVHIPPCLPGTCTRQAAGWRCLMLGAAALGSVGSSPGQECSGDAVPCAGLSHGAAEQHSPPAPC
uniref:Uncharacterized protein n=1 Tax=Pavo cristatus TaxID=9049 RepID=A0A8C9FRE9_PAVCR